MLKWLRSKAESFSLYSSLDKVWRVFLKKRRKSNIALLLRTTFVEYTSLFLSLFIRMIETWLFRFEKNFPCWFQYRRGRQTRRWKEWNCIHDAKHCWNSFPPTASVSRRLTWFHTNTRSTNEALELLISMHIFLWGRTHSHQGVSIGFDTMTALQLRIRHIHIFERQKRRVHRLCMTHGL
jgi:hypothetical protein